MNPDYTLIPVTAMEKGEMTDLCRQWASSQQSAELAEEIPSAEAKIREEIRHKPPVKRVRRLIRFL